MATVHLGLRINSTKCERVTLNDVNLGDTVDAMRKRAAAESKAAVDAIELVHCGVVLRGCDTLEEAGISSGAMIHCLPRREHKGVLAAPLSLPECQTLLDSLKRIVMSPNFRPFVQKLKTPDVVEKILTQCPVARGAPAALAMLQDPELFLGLVNRDNFHKVIDNSPAVGRVAEYVVSLAAPDNTSPRRHHVSYSLDALSDDEDMDADQSDSGGGSRSSGTFQPITPAQLAAALASASGGSSGGSGTSFPSSSGFRAPSIVPRSAPSAPLTSHAPPAGASTGSGPITHEMFSNALQNALAASASRTSLSSSAATSAGVEIPNLEESLQQMREMGIVDEDLSRQALQATSGDVQAAVNLIFAQWMADD